MERGAEIAMYRKYHNRECTCDGLKFDSYKEKAYYEELKLLQRAGAVKQIETQVKYVLQEAFKYMGKTERAITYIADFRVTYTDGHIEIVDVKGFKTDVYKLKRKMLLKQLAGSGAEAQFKEV